MLENYTREYLDDILVRLAHHSSAMEGNTISLADTISIILHETIPGRASKREFYEIENHKAAFEFIIDAVDNDQPLSVQMIKDIHQKLTDRLQFDAGRFKETDNAILGADFFTTPPHLVPTMIHQWVENLNFRLSMAKNNHEKIEAIIDSHIQFERIHPFSDGNGRTGRMLLNFSLMKERIAPLIIDKQHKAEYINYLSNEDSLGFTRFAEDVIHKETERAQRFMNKKNYTVPDDFFSI